MLKAILKDYGKEYVMTDSIIQLARFMWITVCGRGLQFTFWMQCYCLSSWNANGTGSNKQQHGPLTVYSLPVVRLSLRRHSMISITGNSGSLSLRWITIGCVKWNELRTRVLSRQLKNQRFLLMALTSVSALVVLIRVMQFLVSTWLLWQQVHVCRILLVITSSHIGGRGDIYVCRFHRCHLQCKNWPSTASRQQANRTTTYVSSPTGLQRMYQDVQRRIKGRSLLLRVQRGKRARRRHQELRGQGVKVRAVVSTAMSQLTVGISHPIITSVQHHTLRPWMKKMTTRYLQ